MRRFEKELNNALCGERLFREVALETQLFAKTRPGPPGLSSNKL
jgi:hypothetical protein